MSESCLFLSVSDKVSQILASMTVVPNSLGVMVAEWTVHLHHSKRVLGSKSRTKKGLSVLSLQDLPLSGLLHLRKHAGQVGLPWRAKVAATQD